MSDDKIRETLQKYGEPMAGNVWRVQGTAVIYHKCLERIAAQAKIAWDEPKVIRAERDECIIQVTGRLPDGRMAWSIGEALVGVNYRVSGKQAAYVYAMAEKRAKDRVILKLIELEGYVASEEEGKELKEQDNTQVELEREGNGQTTASGAAGSKGRAASAAGSEAAGSSATPGSTTAGTSKASTTSGRQSAGSSSNPPASDPQIRTNPENRREQPDEDGVIDHDPPATDKSALAGTTSGSKAYSSEARIGQKPEDSVAGKVRANIDRRTTWEQVRDFMNEDRTKEALLSRMTKDESDELHRHAVQRMKDLGWRADSDDASSRDQDTGIVSRDPMHPTNINTLPTRMATAIASARTAEEVDAIWEQVIEEQRIDWNAVPEEIKDKVNAVCDLRVEALKKAAA